jgi:hypothetical protein
MTFSLAYSGEHYVFDCLTGALAAVLVTLASMRLERWWRRRNNSMDAEGVDVGVLKLRLLATIATQRRRIPDDEGSLEPTPGANSTEAPVSD